MSFPAIQCGSMQHFDLYRPCSFRSKVKGHFDILHCVFVENDGGAPMDWSARLELYQ